VCRDRKDAAKPAVLQDAYIQQGNQLITISLQAHTANSLQVCPALHQGKLANS